ncbi:MAG TPA: hypothetical protein VFZ53_11090, partial [Polyangiaceae bacterium]
LNALADALLSGDRAEPALELPEGAPATLNRAQRQLLARARSLGQRGAAVRLAGGWEARIDPSTGRAAFTRSARLTRS